MFLIKYTEKVNLVNITTESQKIVECLAYI